MFRVVIFLVVFAMGSMHLRGQVWDSLGSGTNGPIYAIHLDVATNTLWAGGAFTHAGNNNAAHLSSWRNGSWQTEGKPNDTVSSIIAIDNVPFVGGAFRQIDGSTANGFTKKENGTWLPLGSKIEEGSVSALASFQDGIVVGGSFQSINGQPCSHIGLWRNNRWESLGSGLNGPVRAMATMNNELYVAGDFTQAGTVAVEGIAKWDGTQWLALPGATFGNSGGTIQTLAVWFGRLYAGGCFDFIDGKAVNNIALFDGEQWFPLGMGTDDCVYAIAGLSALYVGGDFSEAGNQSTSRLAKWTGNDWADAGGNFDGPIYDLDGSNSQLFVAGSFSQVTSTKGQFSVNNIARLDFTTGIDNLSLQSGLRVYPNPAQDQVFIATPPTLIQFTITLTDLSGRTVLRDFNPQPGTASLSVRQLPNGVYLLHVLEDNIRQASGRLVIAR